MASLVFVSPINFYCIFPSPFYGGFPNCGSQPLEDGEKSVYNLGVQLEFLVRKAKYIRLFHT